MATIGSRPDIAQIFCEVDDFCSQIEQLWCQQPQLSSFPGQWHRQSRMRLNEVLEILPACSD